MKWEILKDGFYAQEPHFAITAEATGIELVIHCRNVDGQLVTYNKGGPLKVELLLQGDPYNGHFLLIKRKINSSTTS